MQFLVIPLFFLFVYNFFSDTPNLDLMLGILMFTIFEHIKAELKS